MHEILRNHFQNWHCKVHIKQHAGTKLKNRNAYSVNQKCGETWSYRTITKFPGLHLWYQILYFCPCQMHSFWDIGTKYFFIGPTVYFSDLYYSFYCWLKDITIMNPIVYYWNETQESFLFWNYLHLTVVLLR